MRSRTAGCRITGPLRPATVLCRQSFFAEIGAVREEGRPSAFALMPALRPGCRHEVGARGQVSTRRLDATCSSGRPSGSPTEPPRRRRTAATSSRRAATSPRQRASRRTPPASRPTPTASARIISSSFLESLVTGLCGRMESNHHSTRRPGYSRVSSPLLSARMDVTEAVAKGVNGGSGTAATSSMSRPLRLRRRRDEGVAGRARTGAAGITAPDASVYTTATTDTNGDGRARTGGLPLDKRTLSATELRPRRREKTCKRCLDLCGFAAVETRSGRQESNLRSPAPEAGGVPSPPRPDANEEPPAGVEPALPG